MSQLLFMAVNRILFVGILIGSLGTSTAQNTSTASILVSSIVASTGSPTCGVSCQLTSAIDAPTALNVVDSSAIYSSSIPSTVSSGNDGTIVHASSSTSSVTLEQTIAVTSTSDALVGKESLVTSVNKSTNILLLPTSVISNLRYLSTTNVLETINSTASILQGLNQSNMASRTDSVFNVDMSSTIIPSMLNSKSSFAMATNTAPPQSVSLAMPVTGEALSQSYTSTSPLQTLVNSSFYSKTNLPLITTISQSISANVNMTSVVSSSRNVTTFASQGKEDDFRVIIIGVSVGAGLLFVMVFIVSILVVVVRRRQKAPHRQMHYSTKYPPQKKGQVQLLGQDSMELYTNVRYSHKDSYVNKGLESSDGSLSTLPESASSTRQLTKKDSAQKLNGMAYLPNAKENDVFHADYGPDDSNLDKVPAECQHDVSLRLLQPWSTSLENRNSYQFKKLREQVEDGIRDLYRSDREFRKAKMKRFRPGSVIADLAVSFLSSAVEPLSRLHKAVSSGHIGTLDVDKDHPLRGPARIRSTASNGLDVIPLDSPSNSLPTSGSSQAYLIQNGESPSHGATFVVPITSSNLERGISEELFPGGQDIEKGPSKIPSYENFKPLRRLSDGAVSPPSTFIPSSNQSETALSPDSVGSGDLVRSRDSGYLGSPTSSAGFFDADQEASEPARVVMRKSSKQNEYLAPVPVLPPVVPSIEEQQDDEPTVHVALFDFYPVDSRELGLRQGEMVTVLSRDESGWLKVTNDAGKQGWVPETYLVIVSSSQVVTTKETVETLEYFDSVMEELDAINDDVTPIMSPDVEYKPSLGQEDIYLEPLPVAVIADHHRIHAMGVDVLGEECLALFDFSADSVEEVDFREGDRIQVVKKSESGWWRGVVRDKEGWFPSSYVKQADEKVDGSETLPVTNVEVQNEDGNLSRPSAVAEGKIGAEDAPNAFQPPERYTGLFVQILKRQSATDLGEKFRMEDFMPGEKGTRLRKSPRGSFEERSREAPESGPSKPERVAPTAPEEVEEVKSEELSVKLRKKDREKEIQAKHHRLSRSLPPQKPVPPPPTARRLTNTASALKSVSEFSIKPASRPSEFAKSKRDQSPIVKGRTEAIHQSGESGPSSNAGESKNPPSKDEIKSYSIEVVLPRSKAAVSAPGEGGVAAVDASVKSNAVKENAADLKFPNSPAKTLESSGSSTTSSAHTKDKERSTQGENSKTESSILIGHRQSIDCSSAKNSPAEFKVSAPSKPPTKPVPRAKPKPNASRCDSTVSEVSVGALHDATKVGAEQSSTTSKSTAKPAPPKKPLPAVTHEVTIIPTSPRAQSHEAAERPRLYTAEPCMIRNVKASDSALSNHTASSVNGSATSISKKPPVPVKRDSIPDDKIRETPPDGGHFSAPVKPHLSKPRSQSDSVVKPKPAPRTDRTKVLSGQQDPTKEDRSLNTSQGKTDKPVRPPPPSLKAKLEGERIILSSLSHQVKTDRDKVRTAVQVYQSQDKGELDLEPGDMLYELEVYAEHGVGYGLLEDGKQGFYPLSHVKASGNPS